MTSIIIAALGVAVVGLAFLALRLRRERDNAEYDRDVARDTLSMAQSKADYLNTILDDREATIARLSPLAEIGERVGNQARDERGRFKAKGK